MYIDDKKFLQKELGTLIQTIMIYNDDRGMEFGIEKCARLIMKSGKREIVERIELQNHKNITSL